MSISFSGLASGLDTSSWVTSLTQLRQAKVTKLEAQKTDLATAQTTLQGIRSFFSSFRSSIEKITDSKFNVSSMDIFSKKLAAVSNAAVLSATAKSNAAEGSYEVKVNNTATQTQVKSGYRYKTTLVSTTQATTNSYLKNVGIGYGTNPESGVTAGNIEITHNDVTSTISISANETMDSFLGKLHAVGINAEFDNDTGIFSIDVNVGDINDVDHTNILSKLKISDINYGYSTEQLNQVEEEVIYHQATSDTLLSDLGINAGDVYIRTSLGDYQVTIDEDETIGSFVSALVDSGIEAAFNDGVFSINNAFIYGEEDGVGLIEHFGLATTVSQTQQSDGLTYQSVTENVNTATLDNLLSDINGVTLEGDETIEVQNAAGETSTITVGTDTTIGDLVNMLNDENVGLNATFVNGVLNIDDGFIVGGTFDIEGAFGLEYSGEAAMVVGNQLTVTTTTISGATGDTHLKDLVTAVTSGTVIVTDTSGNDHELVIEENDTINDVIDAIHTIGLGASFNNSTGVLTLTGGSYTTAGVQEGNASNFLQVFFGQDTLTPSTVDSASARSQALTVSVESSEQASGSTTLGELGLEAGTYYATFMTGETEVTVTIDGDTTLDGLVSALNAGGLTQAEFNAETSQILLGANSSFVGVTGGNFAEIMNFDTYVAGTWAMGINIRPNSVTTGIDMTSAGAVTHTVESSQTVTTPTTTTTPQAASSDALIYNTTSTTAGSTEGVDIISEALNYNETTTTPVSQTSGTITYANGTETVTVGQTATGSTMSSYTTTVSTQTSGTLVYSESGTETTTVGTTETSTIYITSTFGNEQTSTITYEVTSVAEGATSTVMADNPVQTSTLTYDQVTTIPGSQTLTGIDTLITSSSLTYDSVTTSTTVETTYTTTTVNATSSYFALGMKGSAVYVSDGGTTIVGVQQTSGVLSIPSTTTGVSTTSSQIKYLQAVSGQTYVNVNQGSPTQGVTNGYGNVTSLQKQTQLFTYGAQPLIGATIKEYISDHTVGYAEVVLSDGSSTVFNESTDTLDKIGDWLCEKGALVVSGNYYKTTTSGPAIVEMSEGLSSVLFGTEYDSLKGQTYDYTTNDPLSISVNANQYVSAQIAATSGLTNLAVSALNTTTNFSGKKITITNADNMRTLFTFLSTTTRDTTDMTVVINCASEMRLTEHCQNVNFKGTMLMSQTSGTIVIGATTGDGTHYALFNNLDGATVRGLKLYSDDNTKGILAQTIKNSATVAGITITGGYVKNDGNIIASSVSGSTIQGVVVDRCLVSVNDGYQGMLFDTVTDSSISNVVVSNSSIQLSGTSASGFASSITGSTTISNVRFTSVTVENTYSGGGAQGFAMNVAAACNISNISMRDVDVTASSTTTGFVDYANGTYNNIYIDATVEGGNYSSGFARNFTGTATNVNLRVDITGDGHEIAGVVSGNNTGTFNSSNFYGNISGKSVVSGTRAGNFNDCIFDFNIVGKSTRVNMIYGSMDNFNDCKFSGNLVSVGSATIAMADTVDSSPDNSYSVTTCTTTGTTGTIKNYSGTTYTVGKTRRKVSSTAKLSEINPNYNPTGGVIQISNGNKYTVTSTSTVAQMVSFLNNNGISVNSNLVMSGSSNTITSISSSITNALNLTQSGGSTGSHTVNEVATSDSLLQYIGGTGIYTLASGATIEALGSDTISSLIAKFNAAGVNATFNSTTHKLTVNSSTGSDSIIGVSGNARNYWFNGTSGIYTQTTGGGTITNATTLSALGLTDISFVPNVIDFGDGTSMTVTASTTFGQLVSGLTSHHVTASLTNGNLTVGNSGDSNYISDIGANLAAVLNISAGEDVSYDTQTGSGTTFMTTATTLADLGYTGGSIVAFATFSGPNLTVSSSTTVGHIINTLNSWGYNAGITADGEFRIDPTHTITLANTISAINSNIRSALGLNGVTAFASGYTNSEVTSREQEINISSRNSNPVSMTNTLAYLGYTDDFVVYNTNGDSVNIYSTDTLGQFVNKLRNIDIEVDCGDIYGNTVSTSSTGILSGNELVLTFEEDADVAISCIEKGDIGEPGVLDDLEVGYGRTYTRAAKIYNTTPTGSTTTTITTTQTVTATNSTTFAELGLTQDGYIVTNQGTVTVSTTDTFQDVVQKLKSIDCAVKFRIKSDGQIRYSSEGNDYIESFSQNLENIFTPVGMIVGEDITYTASGAPDTYQTNTVTATSATTLSAMMTDASNTFTTNKIKLGSGHYITVHSTDTVGDVVSALNNAGIYATLQSDGTLTVGSLSDTDFMVKVHDKITALLGFGTNYKEVVNPGAVTTTTVDATCTTTFAELGFAANETALINSTVGTCTVTADMTFKDLKQELDRIGIDFYMTGNVLTIGTDGINKYITSIESAGNHLQNILHIQAGDGYSYNVNSQTITADTTLVELGMSDEDGWTITTSETTWAHVIESNMTVGQMINFLNSDAHLTASLTNGVLSIGPGEDAGHNEVYLMDMSQNLVDAFNGFLVGAGHTYTENYVPTGETLTATIDTTFEQLVFSPGEYAIINTNSGDSVTVHASDTIGDFVSMLSDSTNGIGISASFSNGVLSVGNSSDTNFITSIVSYDNHLQNLLNLNAGEGYAYTVSGGTISADTTLGARGMTSDGDITTDTGVYTFTSEDSIQDVIDTLNNQAGLNASLVNGQFIIEPQNGHYLTTMTSNIADALGFTNNDIGPNGSYYTQQGNSITAIASGTTMLSELGLHVGNQQIVLHDGTTISGIDGTYTIDDLIDELSSHGVTASITDGRFTLGDVENDTNFVESMSFNLRVALGLESGEGATYTINTVQHDATTETTLETLGLGSGSFNIVTNNSTLTFTNQDTVGSVIAALTGDGFDSVSLNASHQLVINATDGHYIDSVDSQLASVLHLSGPYNTVNGDTTTTTPHTATLDTTLATLGMVGTSGTIITNDGNINISSDDTIQDVIDKLGAANITASLDANGIFTIGDSGDENYVKNMSDNLKNIFRNMNIGDGFSYNVQNGTTVQTVTTTSTTTIDANTTFGEIMDFAENEEVVLSMSHGNTVTVTSDTTMSEFMSDMNNNGVATYLTNGFIRLEPFGGGYIINNSSAQRILGALNIAGHTYDVATDTIGDTKLKDLMTNTGNLGITSGNINVYKDGVQSTIYIDNNSTLSELNQQLSAYGITICTPFEDTVVGFAAFAGVGNSYLSEVNGGTNLLTQLGITNWTQTEGSASQSLAVSNGSNEIINGNTKLVDLNDAEGNSIGITTGKYKIVSNGINYEGSISASTTVNDFFSQLAMYGINASINSEGQISIGTTNDDTYLVNSNGTAGYSNIVDELFPSWTMGNIYNSRSMSVSNESTTQMTSSTRLKDIDQGTYQAGKIVVSRMGEDDEIIQLSENATVGDFMSAIAYYGFTSYIQDGKLIVKNDGYTTLNNYNVPSESSNVLSLLGLNTNPWEAPGIYNGSAQNATTTETNLVSATRDTKLSELRYSDGTSLGITTGEYIIQSNGIQHTVNLTSTDITLDSFMNMLSDYGINSVLNVGGSNSILKIVGSGDSYLISSEAEGASNIVEQLFNGASPSSLYAYSKYEETSETVTTTVVASLATALSDYDNGENKSEGILALNINGNYSQINITSYETFGSLIEKFERAGVQASLVDGVLKLETGNKSFVIDAENTTSNLLSNLGLVFSDNLGGFAASSEAVTQTTTTIEDRTLSVAKYADYDTQLGLLNISSGTLSVYRNGAKKLITIDNTETFDQFRSRIQDAFGDVDIDFVDGKLRFFSTTEGVDIQVGSSNDSSNISSICGFSQDENGDIISARELYKVNASSVITTAGLFRYGDVTEGTFVVGDATFNITSETTIQNIVSQINSSDKANASAYWDSVDGKLVISSRTTGATMVNIEAGTSNFTDILGLTSSEWDESGNLEITRIRLDSQELGQNARFSINGTNFQSASNVVTSDVSRIQGLTLNLKSSSMGDTVTVTVSKDSEAVSDAVGEFVDAYNELVENVDAELATGGALKDQSTLKFIRQQIRNLLVNTFAGATTFRNLAALGISTSAGNTVSAGDVSNAGIEFLYFDAEKFMEGYNKDAEAVKNMLVGSDSTPGILMQIENIVENALATGTGYFSIADKSYSDKILSINEKIKKANLAVEAYKARLESKFQSMDLLISQMQNQYNSFLNNNNQN